MKRLIPLLVTAALAACAGNALSASLGVGVFGGTNISIVQDDNKGGSIFGIRAPLVVTSFLTVEPYFATSSGGTATDTFGDLVYSRSGYDLKAFGANVILGAPVGSAGFKFFPYAGIGTNKMTRTGSDDIKETGYNFGLGIGAGVSEKASIIFRGGMNMVKTGETSRKYAEVTGGVYYNLFKSK